MLKKTIAMILLLVAAAVLVAGCTTGPTEGTPTATPVETTPTGATPTAATAVETTPTGATPTEATAVETTPAENITPGAGNETDLFRTLNTMPEYSILRELLLLAGLDQTLATEGPYTLFAPNNAAFATLPTDVENQLRSDPEGQLTSVLLYHVVPGEYSAEDLQNVSTLETLQGESLTVAVVGDQVTVNGAAVVEPDVMATNGVIHGIDAVLLPENVTVTIGTVTTGETPAGTTNLT